jgi:hypothetical protein
VRHVPGRRGAPVRRQGRGLAHAGIRQWRAAPGRWCGRRRAARGPVATAAPSGRPAEPARQNGHAGGATDRQLETILKIGRAKALDPTAIEHLSLRVFNRKPTELGRGEASELIKQLSGLRRAAR